MWNIVLFLIIIWYIWYLIIGLKPVKQKDKFQNGWTVPIHRLDFTDNDTMIMHNVGINQCIGLCDNDNSCKGFVYVPRDSVCKFKSEFNNPIFARGHITYLKE
jgi:hypothetical protein